MKEGITGPLLESSWTLRNYCDTKEKIIRICGSEGLGEFDEEQLNYEREHSDFAVLSNNLTEKEY